MVTKTKEKETVIVEQDLIDELENEVLTEEVKQGNVSVENRLDYALNRLRGEQEISGRSHWSAMSNHKERGKTLYEIFAPNEKMLDTYYRAFAYLTANDGTKLEVEFDDTYISAWLNFHLIQECNLTTAKISELLDDISKLEELERQKKMEAEAMSLAQSMSDKAGKQSKGVEHYYEMIMAMQE